MRLATRTLLVLLATACLTSVRGPRLEAQQPGPRLDGYSRAESGPERSLEERFRAIPEPQRVKANMKLLAAKPHHIGSPYQKQNSDWLLSQFKAWGFDAHIERFNVLFPTPVERKVELVSPGHYEATLKEPALPDDPTSGQEGQLPTYNAYSADGDVTAPLVYVNYGLPDDYDRLARMGISVKGKIVIAKYGHSWRGMKPKIAYEHGAIGCLIYSDPKDDGYFQGDVYPKGPYRPSTGVQRGSVMEMEKYPGDPETPGWGSTPDARRLPRDSAASLQKIPVLPLSYGDAQPLLAALAGPMAPEPWRGALPIPYHIGPGPATVHLVARFDWNVVPAYDVIARIPGSTLPDQWIVRGNHYDGWVNGAADPISGQSAMLEEARAFGELLKTGWKPKRTIVYAAWDGEEPMLLGSTEWAEAHRDELQQHAVVYINSDGNGKGYLRAGGSQSLEHVVNDIAKDITDPETGQSVWTKWHQHSLEGAETAEAKADLMDGTDLHIGSLGSGSDYSSFLQHDGLPTLAISYGGEGGGGVYHSIYDDFYWYTHFSDTTFVYGRALAQTYGTLILRLASADVLPFRFSAFAKTLSRYNAELQKLAAGPGGAPGLDLTPLTQAIASLTDAASEYDAAISAAERHGTVFELPKGELDALNTLLYQSEQKLLSPNGLPRRSWYKHTVTAPGYYTGYGAKTIPGVREALEAHDWKTAGEQEAVVVDALNAYTAQIQAATAKVRAGGSSR